jgi:ribonuclease HI
MAHSYLQMFWLYQPQTNQRGELLAIHQAVNIALEEFPDDNTELHIYTDSMYSKNCLTVWLPGWIQNNWNTSQGKPVVHRDLIEETTKLLAKFRSYIISYVPAHTGGSDEESKHNEKVDRMAVAVLNPEIADVKIIHTNTQVAIEGLPITLMGPPVGSSVLAKWCRENLDKLDQDTLDSALLTVLAKTLRKNGYELEKQRLHRNNLYRLCANNLITESAKVIKEE